MVEGSGLRREWRTVVLVGLVLFGSYMGNLYVLFALLLLLMAVGSMNVKIHLQPYLWWILLGVWISLSGMWAPDPLRAILLAYLVLGGVVASSFIAGSHRLASLDLRAILALSGVHLVATFVQIVRPDSIAAVNSRLLKGANLETNESLASIGAYAGISGQTGLNALYLTVFSAAAFAWAISGRKFKLLRWVTFGAGIVAVVYTLKFGILLANATAVAMILLSVVATGHSVRAPLMKFLIICVGVIGVGLSIYRGFTEAGLSGSGDPLSVQEDLLNGRDVLWAQSWMLAQDHIIVGAGAGSVGVLLGELTHNSYLQALAEIGIIGLGLLVIALGTALFSAFATVRRSFETPQQQNVGPVVMGTYLQVFFVVYAMSGNPLHGVHFVLAYMAGLGLCNGARIGASKEGRHADSNIDLS